MSSQLIWLITGTSGFGHDLTLAALRRGDKVIATTRARSITKLEELKAQGADILELDVTSPIQTLQDIAKKAVSIYGRIDVLVNNAGYFGVGTIEESTPEETMEQFMINLFGALNLTRTLLPYMRERRAGTIVWMGSMAGWGGLPYGGQYAATKWALRGISETVRMETEAFGLRSVCFDFGAFRTSALATTQRTSRISRIADYKPLVDRMESLIQSIDGKQPGDSVKAMEAVIDVVKGEGFASGKSFPHFVTLGSDSYKAAKESIDKATRMLEEWKDLSCSTDF